MCLFSTRLSTHSFGLMNPVSRIIALSASLLGFTGVALGAFGAHLLKERLTASGNLGIWQTAVLYQLIHAVALLALVGWPAPGDKIKRIAQCWLGGTVLFSGSLYALALGGPKLLGPITPGGGLLLLGGWFLVALNSLARPKP